MVQDSIHTHAGGDRHGRRSTWSACGWSVPVGALGSNEVRHHVLGGCGPPSPPALQRNAPGLPTSSRCGTQRTHIDCGDFDKFPFLLDPNSPNLSVKLFDGY